MTPVENPVRCCRVCGCLEQAACTREGLFGLEVCHWVEADLCSACAEEQDGDAQLLGWQHPPRVHDEQAAGTG